MKRILALLIVTATLGLASCKKDNVIQETVVPNRTILFTIEPNDWKANTDRSNYNAEFSIPAIDNFNVKEEGILVYFDHPTNANSYIQLPYTYSGQSYSYEHFDGGLSFDIQRANFATEFPKQPTIPIKVKVILIPSMR